jgi:hypothetical protein
MADDTPVLHLPFPEGDDAPNGPAAFQALAEAVEGAVIPPGLAPGQGLVWDGSEFVATDPATQSELTTALALKQDAATAATDAELTTHKSSSDHDGRYYTEAEVDALLAAKAAKATRSTNQSIPNDAMTTVTFPAEAYDTDAIHDTAVNSGRLTAKTAGLYVVHGRAHFETSTLILQVSCVLRVNGAVSYGARDMPVGGFDGAWPIGTSDQIPLAVNDYVEFRVYQLQESGTAAKNIEVAEFSMARLGPLA